MGANRNLQATAIGIVAGIVVAVALLFTVGLYLGFAAVWTCVPAHGTDPLATGCSAFELKTRLVLVLAICLLPAWPVFTFTRRRLLRRRERT
jgi:hypothetical protein